MAVAAKQPQSSQAFEVFNMMSTPVCRHMPALAFGSSTAGSESQIGLRFAPAPPPVVDGPMLRSAALRMTYNWHTRSSLAHGGHETRLV
jgi:hypothetical protein